MRLPGTLLFFFVLSGICFAQNIINQPIFSNRKTSETKTATLMPALGWEGAAQSYFPTSLAAGANGDIWVGTEDKGVWRYDVREKTWAQYTARDGLGDDNIYALAVDKLGRVWAGHLNHGVSVFNGEKWRNYNWLDGPLGDRIFSMAICPTDGDVWIGTDCGVARYSIKKDEWDYYTRAAGLPSDQISAIAFDKAGNIFLGTQCDGIAMAAAPHQEMSPRERIERIEQLKLELDPLEIKLRELTDIYFEKMKETPHERAENSKFAGAIMRNDWYQKREAITVIFREKAEQLSLLENDEYKNWRVIRGPTLAPNSGAGENLPGNLINDITAMDRSRVFAATTCGIAKSDDGGKSWRFVRGADWKANLDGEATSRKSESPPGVSDEAADILRAQVEKRLAEVRMRQAMRISPFREEWVTRLVALDDKLWIGYRRFGLEQYDPKSEATLFASEVDSQPALDSVRAILFAPNGTLLTAVYDSKNGGLKTTDQGEPAVIDIAEKQPLLFPAKAKNVDQKTLISLAHGLEQFSSMNKGDAEYLGDDWRSGGDWTGRYGSSYARLCGAVAKGAEEWIVDPRFEVEVGIGSHAKDRDAWATNFVAKAQSANPRVLYNPQLGARCESEKNDGSNDLETYPLAWDGPDLHVTVKVPAGVHRVSLYFHNNDAHDGPLQKYRDYDVKVVRVQGDDSDKHTLLARARVTDFAGGVYKKFLVCGPDEFLIMVGRNHSHGTKLQGVFIDQITGDKSPLAAKSLPGFDDYSLPDADDDAPANQHHNVKAARELWQKLDQALDKRGNAGLQFPFRILAYRAAAASGATPKLLTRWRWQMAQWMSQDREAFNARIARASVPAKAAR